MNRTLNLLILSAALSLHAAAAPMPVDLRCDYAANPLGVDSATPRLFWKLESRDRDQHQSAYEILVASSPKQLAKNAGDLWDSGKVSSAETIQIPYAGKKLNSFQQVFWKVRIWDAAGKTSESQPATWTMGVLQPSDWHAKWIGASDTNLASLLMRHDFTVKPHLKRALVNICGLGQYELTVNGQKIGDDYLSPGWTEYNKTCLYETRDITENLKRGDNAIGIELGNGMYNVTGGGRFTKFKRSFGPQKAIAQIRLEYADGSVEFVSTDEKWQVLGGPITFSSIYGGEDYDGRHALEGWNKPGFTTTQPLLAQVLDGPGGELRGLSCAAPALKLFETHKAVASHTLTNGDVVYDLGQNASHIWEITASGPKGSKVSLMPSELLGHDGSVDQGSMGAGRRGPYLSEFTKGTDHTETWSPKFYFVGCRYYQIHLTAPSPGSATLSPSDGERDGVRGLLPKIKSVAGRVMHSSSAPVGDFECSNDLFNRTRTLVRWAQRNNMFSILTDCPHREKLGWLEQTHLNGPSIRYEFALDQLFTKTLNDIADSQLTNGLVPTTAPEYAIFADKTNPALLRNNFGDSPEWSAAIFLVPWQQYEFSGDVELFRRHYDAIKDYIAYLGTRSTNYILNFGLGDWYDLGPKASGVSQLTPIGLTATAFYFQSADVMSRVAALLGKTEDAQKYSELAGKIRAAFNDTFYDPTNRTYGTGSQCANAVPLVMNLCEATNRAAVLDALVRDIRAHDNANTAGDVGYRYVLRALADNGRSDVIFAMNNQTNKPGYGMQLAKGKTSLTEGWDGGHSQDHFMLGQIEEWFYHDLAGIQNAPDSAGFKHIVIAPQPVGDITWVKASYNSIRGKIVSDWKRERNKFTLHVSIPANTTATIFVPGTAAPNTGAKSSRSENDRTVIEIGSGDYTFLSETASGPDRAGPN